MKETALRRRVTYQALCMGAFGIFWTAVALRLAQPPFELGQTGIALFTLAGVGGAVAAPVAGWAGDRGWNALATRVAHAAVVVASILAGLAGARWFGFDPTARPALSLTLLAISAVVLDLGVMKCSNRSFAVVPVFFVVLLSSSIGPSMRVTPIWLLIPSRRPIHLNSNA